MALQIGPWEDKFPSVLIFGPPGSGKGTLGRALAAAGGQCHISTGDIFRGLSRQSPAGKLLYSYIDQGLLVPDESAIKIWHHYTQGLIATNRYFPEEQYLLLDGIPRTRHQAEVCDTYLDVRKILLLEVSESVLHARLERRAGLEGRVDDADKKTLHKRFEVYQEQTAETLEHYSSDLVAKINGDQRPLEVLRDALVTAGALLASHARPPGLRH